MDKHKYRLIVILLLFLVLSCNDTKTIGLNNKFKTEYRIYYTTGSAIDYEVYTDSETLVCSFNGTNYLLEKGNAEEIVSTTAPTDSKFHPAKKQIIPIMILMNASINPGIRRCNEKTIKKARTANPTETTSRGKRKSIGICPQLLFLPANIAQVKTQTTAAMIIYSHCIRIASIFAIISQP